MADTPAKGDAAAASAPPSDYTPWLAHWTYARAEEEKFEELLAKQGLPWALRKVCHPPDSLLSPTNPTGPSLLRRW